MLIAKPIGPIIAIIAEPTALNAVAVAKAAILIIPKVFVNLDPAAVAARVLVVYSAIAAVSNLTPLKRFPCPITCKAVPAFSLA